MNTDIYAQARQTVASTQVLLDMQKRHIAQMNVYQDFRTLLSRQFYAKATLLVRCSPSCGSWHSASFTSTAC